MAWEIRLLINNASRFDRTKMDELDQTIWHTLMQVNVRAPFLLSTYAKPHLAKQKGAIINITDIHGELPLNGYLEYCQTKAALIMQTKALAQEFAPDIRVNAIAPGAIAWPEDENALDPVHQAKIVEKTLLKTHGSPLYIAQAVLSLAENPYITGQTLRVDGGRVIF